ncbi:MAG: hypothetical protein U1G07_02685 [Verrucomicrobiota bacterium]
MIEWNIQSRGQVCQACHRHFSDQETFHTLLFDQKQSYERFDVCQDCWTAQYSQGATDRKGFVSHWQSVYEVPPPAPPEPIQKETAETLLRKLLERNDPKHAGALFILAVMLERKRLFRVKAQLNENGQRAFVYEHAKSGDLFTIPDVQLQLDQLEEVQRDVAHLLEHGLTTLGAEPVAVTAAEAAASLPAAAPPEMVPPPPAATEASSSFQE